jgi:glycosyltransferase involved in cell wall biosynthesis
VALWNEHYVDQNLIQSFSWLQKIKWWLHPRRHYLFDWWYQDHICQNLKKTLIEFKPDLVIFSEIWLYRYLSIIKEQNYFILFDNHNVESVLFADNHMPVNGMNAKLKLIIEINKIKAIESDLVNQADQVWTCSYADADLLQNLYGKSAKIRVIPNGIDISYYDHVRADSCQSPDNVKSTPRTIIFTATFGYLPNQIAAQLLIEQVFPQLQKQYPGCQLILAGKSPTLEMLEASQKNPDIIVTGFVLDIRPYLALASIVVVPLLQGSGTRLKILEAFAAGRPVVSTTKGVEGLSVQDGRHLLIRDGVAALVEGISELFSNATLRKTLTANAYELAKAEYSWEVITQKVEQNIQELF